ncbi:lasso peptide biosynthesis PqqD family chaperone [Streptomyces sp. NPDC050560]|uniref:lasso peptide biosynthesis PqqD family chaperone n=1 Tax=Streptomyces sp. NPDC050560 TaxID=3365630 RepID=UPI0037A299BE
MNSVSLRLPAHVTLTPVEAPAEADDTGGPRRGAVLLDGRRGTYWQLNPTAHLLVTALLRDASPEEAAEQLCAAYPAAVPRAAEDTRDLIDRLVGSGLLERT